MHPCRRPIGSNIRGLQADWQQTQPFTGLAAVSARCCAGLLAANPARHRPSGSECEVLQQTKLLAGLEAASTRK
eukprot:5834444-Lingulodinium_polyedra.AAC.1